MVYGYARVSTKWQGKNGNSLQEQVDRLREEGCQEIISEEYTGKTVNRPKFEALVNTLCPGDRLVVTKLDRLARTVTEGSQIIKDLLDRDIRVHVLNIGLLENTTIGHFIINTLLAVAELERSMIIERTAAGKAVAKTRDGYHEGRPATSMAKKELVWRLRRENMPIREIVEITGLGKRTIYRILSEEKIVVFNDTDES